MSYPENTGPENAGLENGRQIAGPDMDSNNNNNWPTHTLQQLPVKLVQQQKRQPLVRL